MYSTSLILRFGECSGNCLFNTAKTAKTVSADNQDILYTTILQLIQDGQPVFWTFIITDSDWKNLFFPFCVDAKNDVGSQFSDYSIISYGIMDGIYIEDRIYLVVSVGVAVTSIALAVYFGDWIKALVRLNLVALLLLVQVVYVGIRVYVKGCKRARGYYWC